MGREMGWGGRWEGGLGWGTHVNPWLIRVNVWQKPLQYCKAISLQLIKINEKKVKTNKQKKWMTNKNLLTIQRTLSIVMWQPEWERRLGENGYI